MPDGATHHLLWKGGLKPVVLGSIGIGGITLALTGNLGNALIVSGSITGGYLLERVVNCDLDLLGISDAESRLIRSVIFLPAVAWTTMYARVMQVFGGHRSLWSHMPIFSTFLRLCWFLFPVILARWLLGDGMDWSAYQTPFAGVWIGLSIADTIHALADFTSLTRKKTVRKIQGRKVGGKRTKARSPAD